MGRASIALFMAQKCGAQIRKFSQPTGQCAGHAAIWLRCRARRKDFFAVEKGFTPRERQLLDTIPVTEYLLNTSTNAPAKAPTKRSDKAGVLMTAQTASLSVYNSAPKKDAIEIHLMMADVTGATAEQIQEWKEQMLVPEPDRDQWLVDYLTRPKAIKINEDPGARTPTKLEAGNGIVQVAQDSPAKLCFVGMGGHMGRIGHAVAIDRWSRPGFTAYFDPNMGEVVLPDAEFGIWLPTVWNDCFAENYDKYMKFTARKFSVFES